MMWYHDDLSWGGWIVMTIGMLAFWALVVGLVVYVVRSTDRSDRHPEPRNSEQILDDRFARGEIDETEYLRRRDVLGSDVPAHTSSARRE
jgi:putative membrane protein